MTTERESMTFDVVIVGAGPAGLGCAIRLKQWASQHHRELSVCVLEKAAEIGGHILSGAVMEPRALAELFPDWANRGAPLTTPVSRDRFLFLHGQGHWQLPVPPAMHNQGNFVGSLGALCRWLAEQAEALGVEIYPGFAAVDLLISDQGQVEGVLSGDQGLDHQGHPGPQYQPGMALRAPITVIAEGCRGSLARLAIDRFGLDRDSAPQTYGLGLKEVWQVDPALHRPGDVLHSVGWPLDSTTYGGGWVYHQADNLISVGLVVGLDYRNPYLNPFQEFQRYKTHPSIKPLFAGARRLAYGARALIEGGFQSIPKLTFPGGLLIGDSAGFMNVAKIKGSHTALKSGLVAADALIEHWEQGTATAPFEERLRASWLWDELYRVRNLRPGFHWGLWPGLAHAALDTWLLRGRAPWTLTHRPDHTRLRTASEAVPIEYPKPDQVLTFDLPSSVFLANIAHDEAQPCHLKLADPQRAIEVNLRRYAAPETRYCPAGVYEIVENSERQPTLRINAQNCLHCKTCDIKDPTQNIRWTPPEGGSGPFYPNL